MKMPAFRSHHLVIILAMVMTIITGLLLLGLNHSTEDEIVDRFNAEQLHLVKDFSRDIQTYLTNRIQLIDVLSSLSAFQRLDSKSIASEIEKFITYEKRNFVTKLSLYDETGTIIYSSRKEIIGHKLTTSDIFQWAIKAENKGKQFISAPIMVALNRGDSIRHLHFSIAAPIYRSIKINDSKNSSQKFVGVITETVDFDNFLSAVIYSAPHNKDKELLWIMDKGGTLLFHADHPQMVFANINKQDKTCMNCHVSFQHINTLFSKNEGNIEFQLKDKPKKLAGFTSLEYKNMSWRLVLNLPAEKIHGFVRKNLFQSYFLLGMIALTFFIISVLIYRSYRLRAKAEAEYDQLVEKSSLKEKIIESENRYRNLVESSPDAIAIHCKGIIVYCNEACAKLFGALKPNDIMGKAALEFVHPDFHDLAKNRMKEVVQNNKPSSLVEEKFVRIDGSIVEVDVIAIPTTYYSTRAVQVVVRDISERKRTEKELMEQMEEISRFNRQMVGREKKMIELKNEINSLLEKEGQPKKYTTKFD